MLSRFTLVPGLIAVLIAGCNPNSRSNQQPLGCSKDSDCKGDRICVNSECVEPNQMGGDGGGVADLAGAPTNHDLAGIPPNADLAGPTPTPDLEPACASGCTLGATSCNGNGVLTCVSMGACTGWSLPTACANGTVCSGGACVAQCTDQCTTGSSYCSGTGVRMCIAVAGCNDWSPTIMGCPNGTVCSAGRCVPNCSDQCALGAKQCSGTAVQTCERKPTGCLDWSDPVACGINQTCAAGACVGACTNKCNAGDVQCFDATSTQACAVMASGCTDWGAAQPCPNNGACALGTCSTCTAGASRCGVNGDVEQCMNGMWVQTMACAFGCANAACNTMVTCNAGAYQCSGNDVQICNGSGTAWLYSQTCSNACTNGLCTGTCNPGDVRCNGLAVETCNMAGNGWAATTTCMVGCTNGTCDLASLDLANNMNLDGVVVVDGPVRIRTGATLTTPTGNLTIKAQSITVDQGGSIAVLATGQSSAGTGAAGAYSQYRDTSCSCNCFMCIYYNGGGGGGYGTAGGTGNGSAGGGQGGPVMLSDNDAVVIAGAPGGNGGGGGSGGAGGGVLQLIANSITMSGQITANGAGGNGGASGGGGGSGGGVLLAADSLTVSGAISAAGGAGGPGTNGMGGNGGNGRIRLLYGSTKNITGSFMGSVTQGLMPPLTITSSTHPNPALIYNDNFYIVSYTWNQAFPARQGYYFILDQNHYNVPTPAPPAMFLATELTSFPGTSVSAGSNYFHVVSVDAMANVGTVENSFVIQVNSTPPSISSTSHPNQTTWTANNTVFLNWTFPVGDNNLKGAFYVLDHFGDTVPTASATFLPITQKQLIFNALASGVWVFHLVSEDQRDYLTKQGAHYQVRIGTDPGSGTLTGTVVDNTSHAVVNAMVSLNRGVITNQFTDGMGNYNFGNVVPAGTWELEVNATGFKPATQMVTITANMTTTANVTLMP
jgi:hypothetical protein